MKKRQGFLRLNEVVFLILAALIVLVFGSLLLQKGLDYQAGQSGQTTTQTGGSKEGMSLNDLR